MCIDMNTLKENLNKINDYYGWTVRDFVEEVGLKNTKNYYNLFSGIKSSYFKVICNYFGISLEQLKSESFNTSLLPSILDLRIKHLKQSDDDKSLSKLMKENEMLSNVVKNQDAYIKILLNQIDELKQQV